MGRRREDTARSFGGSQGMRERERERRNGGGGEGHRLDSVIAVTPGGKAALFGSLLHENGQ